MIILGIETSCDETSAAVVKDGRKILSNIIVSSLNYHKKYGGVIPEIASRKHYEVIDIVTNEALRQAGCRLKDVDKIAVTSSPGLIGSLLVGVGFAKALSYSADIPLAEVDHISAHLYSSFLYYDDAELKTSSFPSLPAIGLVVSGGHTSLYLIKNFSKFVLLGKTLDDASGESFDKVAKILNLGYPGGPVINKLASKVSSSDIKFTCARLSDTFDFSFSGIKTAVLYYVKDNGIKKDFSVEKVAHAFQSSVVDILVEKSLCACRKYRINNLIIGGGVAANSCLRERLLSESNKVGVKTFVPKFVLCTDNAAMVAGLGYHIKQRRLRGKL